MARIYIGRTTGIGAFERHVVLKLILAERADDSIAVSMFLDEARLAAMLNHQNVAQVFEVGEDAGIHYLAMEYVHGQDLRAFLAKAGGGGIRVPIELGLTVVAGAAAGLNHAHERRASDGTPLGIVHRDVSPSNIMIGYDGSVKMLDFGIAKAAQRSVETVSGIIKGKFAYMSPEQCRGREVDRRSDVFSLGIILYEVTTQHRCFRADSDFDTMHRIVTGDVVRPTRIVANYPPALEAIVLKALSVDATHRFQSAGLLLEAIENYSLQNRTPLSTMALGRFMREMFGEIQEPWLVAGVYGVPGDIGHQASEGTISNTNDKDGDARYPSATEPPPFGREHQPPASTLRMSSDQIDDAMRGNRLAQPSIPFANRTMVDPSPDEHDDWSGARGYPSGPMPAVASAQTMPPESMVAARPQMHEPAPRGSAPHIHGGERAQRDSSRPPPATLQGMPAVPVNVAGPHTPVPVGSSPGMQPFPAGTMPMHPQGGHGYPPMMSPGSGTMPPPLSNRTGPAASIPPPSSFAHTTTGSGLSHSQAGPYPLVGDLEGYDPSLRPGRRGLYIGIGLATFGLIIAIAIGRSGGDGPQVANDSTDPNAGGSATTTPAVLPEAGSGSAQPSTTPSVAPTTPTPAIDGDKPKPGSGSATKSDSGATRPGKGDTGAAVKPDKPSGGPDPEPDPGATPDPGGETPPTTAAAGNPGAGSADEARPPEPTPEPEPVKPPAPATIKVVLKSDPPGADVLKDGKKVGRTPYDTTLPLGTGSTPFTVHRDGFVDQTVTIKHVKDIDQMVRLDRKKETKKGGGATKSGGGKTTKTGGAGTGATSGGTTGTSTTTTTTKPPGEGSASKACQKRGGPIQPFGPKLPLCPE